MAQEQKAENYFWGHSRRFNDYTTYIKNRFGKRVQKLSVNAGFTCPNRDGSKSRRGCSYCNNNTFRPSYCEPEKSITQQLNEGINFFKSKYSNIEYVAYFQSFSNTYAPLEILQKTYEEALSHPMITGLVIGTRPDCVDETILEYIGRLSGEYSITIEYGVESTDNNTLNLINRQHDFEMSQWAIREAARRDIHVGAHLILGLPGESREMMLNHARRLSVLPLDSLKLHQLQIIRGTALSKAYQEDPEGIPLFDVNSYIDLAIDFLELLSPQITIERFISHSPSDMLIAPKWGLKNFEIVRMIEQRMEERDTWQGRYQDIKVEK